MHKNRKEYMALYDVLIMDHFVEPFTPFFRETVGFTPNGVTWLSNISSLIALVFLWNKNLLLFFVFWHINYWFDCMAFVGILEWLGGISLMVGLFYFIFLLWAFAKELWAEKCGKACRVKGCGKEKKGGGGLEMGGSWKEQATTNPLFQSDGGKKGGHASV